MSEKKEKLAKLEEEMTNDSSLPLITNLVFGEGDPDSKVVFIGEAPGLNEDIQKRPFVGRGGKLLDSMIEMVGLKRENVYITNIVKRRPPDNRDPSPEEIDAYKPYLERQLDILRPEVIIPLGRFSMNYFLSEAKVTRDQGKVFLKNGKKIMPMFHPAAALRGTGAMNAFRETFSTLPKVIQGEIEVINLDAEDNIKIEKEEERQNPLF